MGRAEEPHLPAMVLISSLLTFRNDQTISCGNRTDIGRNELGW
jgi:hypothetical protein